MVLTIKDIEDAVNSIMARSLATVNNAMDTFKSELLGKEQIIQAQKKEIEELKKGGRNTKTIHESDNKKTKTS